MSAPSFTCPICGRTSWHPQDVEHGYCGACHAYTAEPLPLDELRPWHCPFCGYACDTASPARGHEQPCTGSVSICLRCAEVAVFIVNAYGIRLRVPTDAEAAQLTLDAGILRARESIHEAKARAVYAGDGWIP